jgi:hypothetical protein
VRLYRMAASLCALLALSLPSAAPAQSAPGETILHPAWFADRDAGDVIIYLADEFRTSSSKSAASLYVVTIQRSNPGFALNSVAADVNGLNQYMKANTTVRAADMVAMASGRDTIRVFFRSEDQAFIAKFHYPRADLRKASPEEWNRLSSIGIPDFARYIAKRAVVQASTERQLFGDRVPAAERRTLQLTLAVQAGSPDAAGKLASALKRKNFGAPAPEISVTTEGGKVKLVARFVFSEALVQNLMTEVCADASRHEAQCVDWSARFDTVRVKL